MLITVKRDTFTDKSTTSIISIDGHPTFFGLEDVDRKLECNPECKINGETAIPRGTYTVIIDYSTRFKTLMPHVMDVPGFDGIRIHPGNKAVDTHGCLLVGLNRSPNLVGNSRMAYQLLLTNMEDALDRGEEILIEFK